MTVKQVFNTSAELDFPNVLPTLDLDFANSKTLDPRITFTRASGGTYVGPDGLIKYAGVNEARFDHDPETGESLGLLIEEARANLLPYSEDYSQSVWFKGGDTSVSSNVTLSPDGKLNAYKMNEGNLAVTLRYTANFSASTSYTVSWFVKAAERKYLVFLVFDDSDSISSMRVNLETGEFISGSSSLSATRTMTYYGNGWYRLSMSFTTSSSPAVGSYFDIRISDVWPPGNTGTNNSPNPANGIYIWGAQLEEGSFPTSYIPTQGSTRTRAADNAEITGKNFSDFINPEEGSLILDVIKSEFTEVSNGFIASLLGTTTNYFGLDYGRFPNQVGPTYWRPENADLTTFTIQPPKAFPVKDNRLKYGISYSNNYLSVSETNNPVTIGYPNRPKPTFNTLQFARRNAGSFIKRKIHFRRLTYYPKALQPSQLQSLTS